MSLDYVNETGYARGMATKKHGVTKSELERKLAAGEFDADDVDAEQDECTIELADGRKVTLRGARATAFLEENFPSKAKAAKPKKDGEEVEEEDEEEEEDVEPDAPPAGSGGVWGRKRGK
jgi:hypothetical protein